MALKLFPERKLFIKQNIRHKAEVLLGMSKPYLRCVLILSGLKKKSQFICRKFQAET